MRDRALFLSALLAGLPQVTVALERADDIGKLPALGWSSWNAFGCDINAEKIMTAANQFIELGLKDLGYEYINIDDCYSVKTGRDSKTKRIQPDLDKFPDGISGLASQIHDKGLKVGIYSSAGTKTCAGYPASLGYEQIDAETFAEWGMDYLKYDNCYVPVDQADEYTDCVPDSSNGGVYLPNGTCPGLLNPAPDGYDWNDSNTAKRYHAMRDALLKVDRPILYALCNWGQADVNSWGNETGQSWRVTGDITDSWTRIVEIANENSFYMEYADFWGHPDPDMLEVGNGDLTLEENRAHFALWAAMKSPLIMGTSLDKIDPDHLAILKNKYLLAFNQDPLIGRPAYPYKWGYNEDWTFDPAHPAEYWSGPSSTLKGTLVLMFNSEGEKKTRTAVWSEIPELNGGAQRDDRHQSGRRRSGPYRRDQYQTDDRHQSKRDQSDDRHQSDRHQSKRDQSEVKAKGFQVTDVWTGKDLGCIKDQYEVELESHDIAALVVGDAC